MNRTYFLAPLLAAGLLAGCAAAPIALPTGLAATTQPVALTGMGIGQRGSFALGASSGRFVRHAMSQSGRQFPGSPRETLDYGDGGFTVSGPDFAGVVEGACTYDEAEVGGKVVTVTVMPFRYTCRFLRNGRPIAADLVLQAVPRAVGPLLSETRAGTMRIGDRTIGIEPIHHSPALRIPTGDPLGYRFVVDGRDLGAIDLNGQNKTIFVPADPDDREAVLMAGLALSVLWKS